MSWSIKQIIKTSSCNAFCQKYTKSLLIMAHCIKRRSLHTEPAHHSLWTPHAVCYHCENIKLYPLHPDTKQFSSPHFMEMCYPPHSAGITAHYSINHPLQLVIWESAFISATALTATVVSNHNSTRGRKTALQTCRGQTQE